MSKDYTTVDAVAAQLGQVTSSVIQLTEDQQGLAGTLIDMAEVYIDRETRKGWNLPPITNERYDLVRTTLYLKHAPVTSLDGIQVRSIQVGTPLTTLVAGVDYELLDAALGQVQFADGYQNARGDVIALVSYTPNLPVPADISYATAVIVAYSLYLALYPDRFGIERAQVDRETVLYYDTGPVTLAVPETAQRIIDGYTRRLVV